MSYPYDFKRTCACGSLAWDSLFVSNRCSKCHRNFIKEEYERIYGKPKIKKRMKKKTKKVKDTKRG